MHEIVGLLACKNSDTQLIAPGICITYKMKWSG